MRKSRKKTTSSMQNKVPMKKQQGWQRKLRKNNKPKKKRVKSRKIGPAGKPKLKRLKRKLIDWKPKEPPRKEKRLRRPLE